MSAADDSTITPSELQIRSGLAYLDDSVIALRQVRRALVQHGALIECFSDPAALIDRVPAQPPLVAVLLDVDLGESVDGPTIARQLAAMLPSVAIAFFTAEHSEERTTALAALGPVFDKSRDLEAVVQWFVAHAKTL